MFTYPWGHTHTHTRYDIVKYVERTSCVSKMSRIPSGDWFICKSLVVEASAGLLSQSPPASVCVTPHLPPDSGRERRHKKRKKRERERNATPREGNNASLCPALIIFALITIWNSSSYPNSAGWGSSWNCAAVSDGWIETAAGGSAPSKKKRGGGCRIIIKTQ